MARAGASQCGFCSPGFVNQMVLSLMSLKKDTVLFGFLEENKTLLFELSAVLYHMRQMTCHFGVTRVGR